MLPKASFVDFKDSDENGSSMLSRAGKLTTKNNMIFTAPDPMKQHARYTAAIANSDPTNYDKEKEMAEEKKKENMLLNNGLQPKTDIEGFIKRMNQQKAQIFTQKITPAKIREEPHEDNIWQPEKSQEWSIEEIDEVDIDA